MQIDENAVDSADTNPRPEITMPSTIAKQKSYPRVKIKRVIHAIHAVIDIAAGRAKYLDVLGGLIFAEGYFEPEDRDMALLYVMMPAMVHWSGFSHRPRPVFMHWFGRWKTRPSRRPSSGKKAWARRARTASRRDSPSNRRIFLAPGMSSPWLFTDERAFSRNSRP